MSGIWVFLENKEGKIATGSREAVYAARSVADGLGQPLTGLVFGENVSGVADAAFDLGVDAVLGADDATLGHFRVEAVGPLLTKLAQEHNPSVILASASSRGRDLAAWVAADLEVGLVADGVNIAIDGDKVKVTRPVYAGKLMSDVFATSSTQVITTCPPGRSRRRRAPMIAGRLSPDPPINTASGSGSAFSAAGAEPCTAVTDGTVKAAMFPASAR
jgi:electron transfer flavoprotein alpha subunit